MQPNEITLVHKDVADDTTDVSSTFTLFDNSAANMSTYIGPDHKIDQRQLLSFYRNVPKSNGNYPGVAKTRTKITQDVTVNDCLGNSIIMPRIIEVIYSFPVNVLENDQKTARRMNAALASHVCIDALVSKLEI